MSNRRFTALFLVAGVSLVAVQGQSQPATSVPSATQPQTRPAAVIFPDIPVPEIKTHFRQLPSVDQLPDRPEMPDVMTMNDGTKVTTAAQWQKRRDEMREILEYYATGYAPPSPGNVKGREISSQIIAGGKVKYRLVHLTFGPEEKLFLDIGIYTPTTGGPFPAVVMPEFGSPPGATALPRLPKETPPPGNTGGVNTYIGTDPNPAASARVLPAAGRRGAGGPPSGFGASDPEAVAGTNKAVLHGFAYVTYNYNDCGEDNSLRLPDGSWACRTTRFFPAYPGYDWGLIRAWGWGASRVVDYLESDPSIDKSKLIISGTSRLGKSALYIGAFDDRFAMVAPVASSGLGTPALRFSGADRGGKEGMNQMLHNSPDKYGPKLYQFKDHIDKLPFDQHWFMALVAPRPFIALEGVDDALVNANGVRQSILGAKPAYDFLGVPDRIGAWWTNRPHGIQAGDWEGMLGFADKFLLNKKIDMDFTQFPPAAYPSATQPDSR